MTLLKMSSDKKMEIQAIRLADLQEQRKKIEKEEKELKDFFHREMLDHDCTGIAFDSVVITSDTRERTGLDKEKITVAMGIEWVKSMSSTTSYTQMTVKRF